MHLATGEAKLKFPDLKVQSYGTTWEHTRAYGNLSAAKAVGPNGFGWANTAVPTLRMDGSEAVLQFSPLQTFQFPSDGNSFEANFYFKNILTLNKGANDSLILKSGNQRTFTFSPLTPGQPKTRALVGITEPNGSQIAVQHESGEAKRLVKLVRAGAGGGFAGVAASGPSALAAPITAAASEDETGLTYTYDGDSTRVASVTMRVEGQPVERVLYVYYLGVSTNGSAGDLETTTRETYNPATEQWETLGISYNRYYIAGDPDGFEHALKYIVDEEGFARATAAGINPLIATDEQLETFADKFFRYDSQHRVAFESVRGGSLSYTFTYSLNPNPHGAPPPVPPPGVPPAGGDFNTWWLKTVMTRSDNTQEIAYSNMYGQAILRVFRSSEGEWCQYRRYNEEGRIVLRARPSAVAGYDEMLPHLVTLHQHHGWVQIVDIYAAAGSGGAPSRLKAIRIREGEAGADVLLSERKYVSLYADGRDWYFVSEEREYVGHPGSATAATTAFAYTWHPGTGVVNQRTTTRPAVPTDQNGSGASTQVAETFDLDGRRTSLLDERGITHQWTWDEVRAGVTKQIVDVSGLHLVTDYTLDNLGRTVLELGPLHTIDLDSSPTPIRRAQWTVYLDSQHEERSASGYVRPLVPDDTGTLVNPVVISRYDRAGRLVEWIQAARDDTAGPLRAGDAFPQTRYSRWTTSTFDNHSQLVRQRTYHHVPATGEGVEGFDYAQVHYLHDAVGRTVRVISASGTLTRNVVDTRGLLVAVWVGTNDAGATPADPSGAGAPGNNMVKIEQREYDRGYPGGDGLVTEVLAFTGPSQARVTTFEYDFRGERVVMRGECGLRETYLTDLRGAITRREQWNDTGMVPLLTGRTDTLHDPLGRVYRTIRYAVDPVDGTVGVSLPDDTWFDPVGNVMKRRNPEDAGFEKIAYDRVGRVVGRYAGYTIAAATYAEAQTVVNDTIFEQTEMAYDGAGNLIAEITRERFHNTTGLGALQGPDGPSPNARVLYTMYYPDALGRMIVTANFGTNGGAAPVRPPTAPARSSTVLVTSVLFNDRGEPATTVDPNGIVTLDQFDDAARLVKRIENYQT